MAKTPITVCVVTLTRGEKADLEPQAFVDLLVQAADYFDFNTQGKPYAASMDDWRPFSTGDSLPVFLSNADLDPTFLSGELFVKASSVEVRDRTDLFVIDPVVLMHKGKREIVTGKLQGVIVALKKEFCIILPAALPNGLKTELKKQCEELLDELRSAWFKKNLGAWEIHEPQQLQQFCNAVSGRQANKPNTQNLAQLGQGAQVVYLQAVPKMP